MAADLFTAVLSDRTRSVNFFNGRLLSAEDLISEQKTNRVAHSLLGQAIGSGVVHGLEVSESALSSTQANPVLMVRKGAAINRGGAVLLLADDTEISLVRPTGGSATPAVVFQNCDPIQTGAYVAGAGVYLFTIGPAGARQGLAEVSGVSTAQASCNSKYNANGVQFRILQLQIDPAILGDPAHLQNMLAYLCFGAADWDKVRANPLGGAATGFGLLDQLRSAQLLTDCEVPLAVLYWTANGGLVFVDMWSVRRRITRTATSGAFPLFVNDGPISGAEAMLLQFQRQMDTLVKSSSNPLALRATDSFRFLPPAGIVPAAGSGFNLGVDPNVFFQGKTHPGPPYQSDLLYMEGGQIESLLRLSAQFPPIDLWSGEMIWIYWVRENLQAFQQGGPASAVPLLVFANGQMPFAGAPRFDVSHWGYSNYI